MLNFEGNILIERSKEDLKVYKQYSMTISRKDKKRRNKIRTNLLVMINSEISSWKKNSHTEINSKTLASAEKYYLSQNSQVVSLESENFTPGVMTNLGVSRIYSKDSSNSLKFQKSCSPSKNSLLTIPGLNNNPTERILKDDDSAESSISSIDSSSNAVREAITRKTSVSHKKIEYFNQHTLNKITYEANHANNSIDFHYNNLIIKNNFSNLNNKNFEGGGNFKNSDQRIKKKEKRKL